MIPFDDRGLTLGDGLFETLLVRDGVLTHEDLHLRRMAQGCAILGLAAPDPAEAHRIMTQALAQAGLTRGRAAVRLTLTAGSGGRGLDRPQTPVPRLFATAAPAPASSSPARLAISAVRRNASSPAARLKTLAYLDNVLARREAALRGADEALMLNGEGQVAGAAAGNLFWLTGGALRTPALDCGVLAGIARGRVIALAGALGVAVAEVREGIETLSGADAVFLTNSLIGVREVCEIEGRTFAPSPLAAELARRLEES